MIGQVWNGDQFSEFERKGDNTTAKAGEMVAIAIVDLFDDAMNPQSFEQAGTLCLSQVLELLTQPLIGKTRDGVLATRQGAKKRGILLIEEIEALVASIVHDLSFGQTAQVVIAPIGCIELRDELEIALMHRK